MIADEDLPEDVYEKIEPELRRIDKAYGERDHLLLQIVEYLHSIGRSYHPQPCSDASGFISAVS